MTSPIPFSRYTPIQISAQPRLRVTGCLRVRGIKNSTNAAIEHTTETHMYGTIGLWPPTPMNM